MYFDRFDICEAHYLFLCHYYDGQNDPKYARLCRLTRPGFFKPSPMLHIQSLSENAREIYDRLVEKEEKNKA